MTLTAAEPSEPAIDAATASVAELRIFIRSRLGVLAPEAVCGVAYDLLGTVAPGFAEGLHAPNGLRPLAAGLELSPYPGTHGLRLTALSQEAVAALAAADAALAEAGEPGITLSQHRVYAGPRRLRTGDYPALAAGTAERWELRFLSPTALKREGLHLPLPVPRDLAANWVRRWNAFAPEPLKWADHAGFVRWVDGNIQVTAHQLRTESFAVRGGRIWGFVGRARFALAHAEARDAPEAGLWHALARYSEWAGTGVKTMWGCGQTRLAGLNRAAAAAAAALKGARGARVGTRGARGGRAE